MEFRKGDVVTAAITLSIGAVLGFAQYWPDIKRAAFPELQRVQWEFGTVDETVFRQTANLEQLMALEAPMPGAPSDSWKAFFNQLNHIEMGVRHGNHGSTSPLMAWYAYIAKHHPVTLYEMLGEKGFDRGKFDHLLGVGLLSDWYEYVSDADQVLLSSNQALSSFALTQGEDSARRKLTQALFAKAENGTSTSPVHVDLENVRFAMAGMTEEEQQRTLVLLGNGSYKFDPRSVRRLLLVPNLDRNLLLSLIRDQAYSEKSMSSYMTTGAMLGATDYVATMVEDVRTNAQQPTNFYCAACGIALTSDGLVGQTLVDAAHAGNLHIRAAGDGTFIIDKNDDLRKEIKNETEAVEL